MNYACHFCKFNNRCHVYKFKLQIRIRQLTTNSFELFTSIQLTLTSLSSGAIFSHLCPDDFNTELNYLRVIICSRTFEVTVEIISVCNNTEKMMAHGIHCLPCSYTKNVIDILP